MTPTEILLLAMEKAKAKVIRAEERAQAKVLRSKEKAKAKVIRAELQAKVRAEVCFVLDCLISEVEVIGKKHVVQRRKNPKVKKDESGLFNCLDCDYATPNHNTYCMHLSMKHSDRKHHVCLICDEKFAESTQLRQHNEVNHITAAIPCHDPCCEILFKTKAVMQTHYARKHMSLSDLTHEVAPQCKVMECLSCSLKVPKNGCMYHFAKCNPKSPWGKKKILI